MTMKKHLNIFIPDDLLEALDASAAERGMNRSQAARLAIGWFYLHHEPYMPPALPNWQTEAWTLLLHGLFGDERLVLTDEIEALLTEAIARLNEREAQILRLRFGLDGPRHTLEDAGAAFGLQRSRAHQVEQLAMQQLRYWLRTSGIWKLLGEQLEKGE